MTTDRSRPRPAEADIARNITDLLRRARGYGLTKEEAKVIAVEANRPLHQQADSPDDPGTVPKHPDEPVEQPDEPVEQPDEAMESTKDAYEVFSPEALPWRL